MKKKGAKKSAAKKAATKKAASGSKRTKAISRAKPTAAAVEVDGDVLEFIAAIDEYKNAHERPFPSWSEILHIVKALGYSK